MACLFRILGMAVLVVVPASHTFAQQSVITDSECTDCELRAQRVLTLGSLDGPDAIEADLAFGARDGRGRHYVVERYGTRIKVFGPRGQFIGVLGRDGAGPGEFEGIGALVVGRNDSLYVFDNANVRLTVFDSSGAVGRDARLDVPPQIEAALLGDGRMVIATPVRTPDLAGLPLHLLSSDGRRIRSFGSLDGFLRADIPYIDDRAVAVGTHGVWSAYRNQYVIELWDTAGGNIVTLRREVDWFPSWLKIRSRPANLLEDRPQPYLVDIVERDGLLWVAIQVADPRWREVVRPRQGDHGGEITDRSKYRDTRIEVIDLSSRQVIATVDVDEPLGGFMDDTTLFGTRLDASGVPYLDVWRLTLNWQGDSQ